VGRCFPGRGSSHFAFNAMLKAARLAFGGNQIIPAAGGSARRFEAQHAVSQRIAQMMIEEEPAIQVLVSEFLLNCGQVHRAIISQWGGSIACRAASVRSRPAY